MFLHRIKKLLKPAYLEISHCRCILLSMRRNICRYHACGLSLWSWLILKVDIFCYLGIAASTLGLRSTDLTAEIANRDRLTCLN
jgi:hypothetical protein